MSKTQTTETAKSDPVRVYARANGKAFVLTSEDGRPAGRVCQLGAFAHAVARQRLGVPTVTLFIL